MKAERLLQLALLFLIPACAIVPEDPGWEDRCAQALLTPIKAPEAGEGILAGFDALGDELMPGFQDRLLYHLCVRSPDSREDYFLSIEAPSAWRAKLGDGESIEIMEQGSNLGVTCPYSDGERRQYVSKTVPVQVKLFDSGGGELSHAAINLPFEFLFRGFVGRGVQGKVDADLQDSRSLTMFAASGLANDNEVLRGIIEDFVDIDWLRAVFNFGLSFSIAPDYASIAASARHSRDVPWDDLAYRFPIELAINGVPKIRAQVLVTSARPPVGMTAGLLALSGNRADDPDHRIDLRLVASRRRDGGTKGTPLLMKFGGPGLGR